MSIGKGEKEGNMLYVMLVYQDEKASKAASDEAMAASVERFNAFHEEVMQSGHLVEAQRLHHSDRATTVNVREGKTLAIDGPYAETKEQLGGFYIFECSDLDEAIEIAARIPTAKSGHIEIRPVFGGGD
jgi:hypothetical protein